jgi:hypothetical protein
MLRQELEQTGVFMASLDTIEALATKKLKDAGRTEGVKDLYRTNNWWYRY